MPRHNLNQSIPKMTELTKPTDFFWGIRPLLNIDTEFIPKGLRVHISELDDHIGHKSERDLVFFPEVPQIGIVEVEPSLNFQGKPTATILRKCCGYPLSRVPATYFVVVPRELVDWDNSWADCELEYFDTPPSGYTW